MTISEYLALNDDARFEEVKRATLAAMPEKYFKKYFKSTKKRWLDLTRVWDKVFKLKDHYVLTSVIHKIYWGVYPYEEKDTDFVYLLELVEAELLSNGEAYQSWSKWVVFKKVLAKTLDFMHSFGNSNIDLCFIEHFHYLKSRALCKIKYDKVPSLEGSIYTEEYQSYERIVKQFIPEATRWSREQWGNDSNIADAMLNLYGVDYSDSYEKQRDYERLIQMIRAKKEGDDGVAAYTWYISNISELPLSLARTIWSDNLEAMAASMLCHVYELVVEYEEFGEPFKDRKDHIHPLYHYDRREVKKSWLFKAVNDWFYKGVYSGDEYDRVKAVIFALQTTC